MSRPLILSALGGLSLLFAGVIAWEYRSWKTERTAPLPAATRAAPGPPSAAVPAPAPATEDLVAPILARPLFNPSRRPIAGPAKPVSTPAEATALPRLTGVLISRAESTAIFAGPPNGKSVVVKEGGYIGRYQVQAIRPGLVMVSGPDGTAMLRPTFDPAHAATASTSTAPPVTPPGQMPSGPMIGATPAAIPAAMPDDTGKPSVLDQLRRSVPSVAIPGLPTPGPIPGQTEPGQTDPGQPDPGQPAR